MSDQPAYKNPALSFEERINDLIAQMTLEEKISQMVHQAPAIERLDIPAYNWWNECLHGVGRAGIATVFPQAIGMAATWNADLIHEVATAISDEGRAKHHQALRDGNHGQQYHGLTFWTPNINIFRDPRWGRGQETYGECPYLTAWLGVAFVKGLQGDDPKYLKAIATPKHYAVHSGPEHDRHHFDIDVSERDLRDTYLPAFKATVQEGAAYSVMSAYQRFRGEPCSSSTLLLQEILRDEWGFEGYVVSDCGAIYDIFENHKVVKTPEEAAARAVKAGCELNCGGIYPMLLDAVEQGLIDEATIDQALKRLFMARFKLGMFDPPDMVPYAQIPHEVNDSSKHRELALRTAREAMVLLKNDGLLPLDKSQLKTIAVIGPNADSVEVMLGNYNGIPAQPVTPLAGIRKKVEPDVDVLYVKGCNITSKIQADRGHGYNEQFASAVEIARRADVVIMVMGLSQVLEGEEGQREGVEAGMSSQGDRRGLDLPSVQEELLKMIHGVGKPVVLVLINGSAISVNWADQHVPTIIEAWYPGQAGGTALADVLFGDYNPAGRLPITFYKSVEQLPPFTDYDMAKGRTYRYFTDEALYAFGHGLSYTQFAYSDLQITPQQPRTSASVEVAVTVKNTGDRAGDEVVQLYMRDVEASALVPVRQLAGFDRIHLPPGTAQTVRFTLKPEQFSLVTDSGQRLIEPGLFEIVVGGHQPGADDAGLLVGQVEVIGESLILEP
ncbi:MAG: glycoside hydrolase family 3 C-terminal domain-containing protein [Anaerolineae bacterium]|nr:glycoside hydrolase family 3 C-terminal domain-containing protein [Anaerolineae bacterium]